MRSWIRWARSEDAQGLPEYALLMAGIVAVTVATVYLLFPDAVIAVFRGTGESILNSSQSEALRR